jgi:NADPH2:quinone reductase
LFIKISPRNISLGAQVSNVDVCIEMLADRNLEADMSVMAQNGRIGIVGNRGTIQINPRAAMQKELTIRGVSESQ